MNHGTSSNTPLEKFREFSRPRWARYLIVGVVGWVIFFGMMVADPKLTWSQRVVSSLFTIVFLETIVFCIASLARAMFNAAEKAVANASQPKPAISSAAVVKRRPPTEILADKLALGGNFQISQHHVFTRSSSASGIALNSDSTQICIFDCNVDTGDVKIRLYRAADILNAEVVEEGYTKTESTTRAVTDTKTKTSGTSMVGRAVVGGVLFGPVGAVVGGATAKKVNKGTTKEVTQQVTTEVVRSVVLKIIVNDTSNPLLVVQFMQYETERGSSIHTTALNKANHWQALLKVLTLRG